MNGKKKIPSTKKLENSKPDNLVPPHHKGVEVHANANSVSNPVDLNPKEITQTRPRSHSQASTIEYVLKETYLRRPKPRHPFRIMVSVPFQVLEFHSVTLLPEAGLITKPGKTLQGYKNVLRRATLQGLQRPRCNPPWRSRKFQNREIGAAV